MSVGEICNRAVVVMQFDGNTLEAAKLMRLHHVGDVVVVVEESPGLQVPVGIISDRDLTVEVMARQIDQMVITVGDIMAPEVFKVPESMGVFEASQYLRGKKVRCLAVVDDRGGLVGLLAQDDLLRILAEELLALAGLPRQKPQTFRTR